MSGRIEHLFLLLMGFALLSRISRKAGFLMKCRLLPDDWRGALSFWCSCSVALDFLDNIAAALIGGTVARHVFQARFTSAISRHCRCVEPAAPQCRWRHHHT